MTRRAANEVLKRLLVQNARVDRPLVQFAEREERCERETAIARVERVVLQKRKDESRRFVGEQRKRILAEDGNLWPLDGVEQTELRFHLARARLVTTELRAHRAVKLDEVLRSQIADLSR